MFEKFLTKAVNGKVYGMPLLISSVLNADIDRCADALISHTAREYAM